MVTIALLRIPLPHASLLLAGTCAFKSQICATPSVLAAPKIRPPTAGLSALLPLSESGKNWVYPYCSGDSVLQRANSNLHAAKLYSWSLWLLGSPCSVMLV